MKLRSYLPILAALGLSACALVPQERASTRATPLPDALNRRLDTVRDERAEYPSFRDIPVTPSDVRTPAQWAQAVSAVKGSGQSLIAWKAANPPAVADVDAYAAQARRALGIGPGDVPPPDQAQRIEALARELRARTTPPPPLD